MPQTEQARHFLEVYRNLQRSADVLPLKADLSAEAVRNCIGHVFIVERKTEGYLFRLFGTQIANVTGRDHTGQYLHEVLHGQDHDHVQELMRRCLDDQIGILSVERLIYPGKDFIEVEIFRTPWADSTGVPRFIAGTFAPLPWNEKQSPGKVQSQLDYEVLRDVSKRLEVPLTAQKPS
ncbi:MAG: PAS domain-containing protein [Alphaproteobacteria bacterium]|nr:PAS domain-containing protein [Alphaproteobacteria bacterium]